MHGGEKGGVAGAKCIGEKLVVAEFVGACAETKQVGKSDVGSAEDVGCGEERKECEQELVAEVIEGEAASGTKERRVEADEEAFGLLRERVAGREVECEVFGPRFRGRGCDREGRFEVAMDVVGFVVAVEVLCGIPV